ncbi:uncharacterized protein LOC127774610 [Oryza glaberrima]|uniref:uncharacterized protein LOC127774610 n=1 Tax=Oryza glaberrima TaxID=4538 RepID=UPI00224C6112|nr:uncharacterized protein LOC127774610 [Oryza glaberrima]
MAVRNHYDRSHERFTWRGALQCRAGPKKRTGRKILSCARDRVYDKTVNVPGSCVFYSLCTALEAANRICGVNTGRLSWEDLCNWVDENNPCRIYASLRVLKSRGIRRELDYKKGNVTAKRFKISQFYEFCNVDQINDDGIPCGLDQHNVKGAINNFLSKTVMIASFPISYNYYDFENGFEHIYQYDLNDPVCDNDGTDRIITHAAVITSFGFEEKYSLF